MRSMEQFSEIETNHSVCLWGGGGRSEGLRCEEGAKRAASPPGNAFYGRGANFLVSSGDLTLGSSSEVSLRVLLLAAREGALWGRRRLLRFALVVACHPFARLAEEFTHWRWFARVHTPPPLRTPTPTPPCTSSCTHAHPGAVVTHHHAAALAVHGGKGLLLLLLLAPLP